MSETYAQGSLAEGRRARRPGISRAAKVRPLAADDMAFGVAGTIEHVAGCAQLRSGDGILGRKLVRCVARPRPVAA